MFIFPHPDDETYTCAGLLQMLVKEQIKHRVCCLTKGEKSTLKFGNIKESLKDVRAQEFTKVMNFLGVVDYLSADLPDGELESTPNLKTIISRIIEEYKPSHIVTYEPHGIYGHPDHIAVSQIITTIQTEFSFDLIYATADAKYVPSLDSLKMAKDSTSIKHIQANVVVPLPIKYYINKIRALKLYKSQVSVKHNFRHKLKYLYFFRNEYYYLNSINY